MIYRCSRKRQPRRKKAKKQIEINHPKKRDTRNTTMRPVSGRSRPSSRQQSRPLSSKRSGSRARSRSPSKKATSTKEPNFLFETGTLGSGFQGLSLSQSVGDVFMPQYSLKNAGPEAFVRTVRQTFHKQPEVYKKFVKILSQVEHSDTDKLDLVKRVITLFDGYPYLIEGFNAFLPSEYSIEIQNDAVIIKVFEPSVGSASHGDIYRSCDSLGWSGTVNLGDECTEATMVYVQRVKEMYADQPHKYRQFTDILRDFHGKHVDEVGTIHRIVTLFRKYPHLVEGFNAFLPEGFSVHMYDDKGYDIEYPGDNEGERTIVQFNK